jgi:hypothetical protein
MNHVIVIMLLVKLKKNSEMARGGAVGWGTARKNRKIRGFDSQWVFGIFHWKSFQPRCDLGIYSASNRNEYQEYLLGGKRGWCIGLTTLPPSCADCHETGSLKLLEPSLPVQAYTGITLPLFITLILTKIGRSSMSSSTNFDLTIFL